MGTMRVVVNLAQSLSALEHTETMLFTPQRFRHSFHGTERIQHGNLKIYRIPYTSLVRAFRLKKEYHVVNIHGISFFNYMMGSRWFRPESVKTIYTVHGVIPLEKKYGYRYSPIKQWMEKRLVCRSDLITTVSEETKRLIIDTYHILPEKISVIGNGVDTRIFHPAATVAKARKEGITRILFVGSIVPIKGLDFLLASIDSVKNLPIVLHLVGNKTPYLDHLSKKYSSLFQGQKVVYAGPVEQEKLMQYYSESDFLVLTSEYDQYPQAVLEAFAMGKPAIVSDRVGVKIIIEDGKDGFVVPFGDVEMLTEKIKLLAGNHGLCMKMGEYARRKAEKNSWMMIAKKYSALFHKINAKKIGS